MKRQQVPNKPKTQKAQIDMLWDNSFNHLPSMLEVQSMKLNFTLVFLGIVMVLVSAALGVAILR